MGSPETTLTHPDCASLLPPKLRNLITGSTCKGPKLKFISVTNTIMLLYFLFFLDLKIIPCGCRSCNSLLKLKSRPVSSSYKAETPKSGLKAQIMEKKNKLYNFWLHNIKCQIFVYTLPSFPLLILTLIKRR